MCEWQLSSALAGFPSLSEYPSDKLTIVEYKNGWVRTLTENIARINYSTAPQLLSVCSDPSSLRDLKQTLMLHLEV